MEDKEFILEAIKRLIPDTSWYGETNHDTNSLENLDTIEEILYIVFEELMQDMFVPKGNKGNYSFEKISQKKQKILNDFCQNYEEVIRDVIKGEEK